MNHLSISVIITAYNLERFISASLGSLSCQTRQPEQVLVVDDASTDGTVAIVESLVAKHPTWQLISLEKNSGVMNATLRGIEEARGDVICFLDGDDIWEPRKLEVVALSFSEQPNLLLLSHGYRVIDGTDAVIEEDSADQAFMRSSWSNLNSQSIDSIVRESVLTYGGRVWLGSAWSIRNSRAALDRFIQDTRLREDVTSLYQDHPLAVALALQKDAVLGWVPDKLMRYRIHGKNTSSDRSSLDRAISTIRKARNTRAYTWKLVRECGRFKEFELMQAAKFREISLLHHLYSSRFRAALRDYLHCFFRIWGFKIAMKEFVRFITCLILGPEQFLRLAAKLASFVAATRKELRQLGGVRSVSKTGSR